MSLILRLLITAAESALNFFGVNGSSFHQLREKPYVSGSSTCECVLWVFVCVVDSHNSKHKHKLMMIHGGCKCGICGDCSAFGDHF